MSDLLFRPASELAGLVRSGELSARELVQTSLDRIENKIDHEQALMALRFSRLLSATQERELVESEPD